MTILFDGLDLSGKSAIAQIVAAELGAAVNSGGIHDDVLARWGRRVFAGNAPNIIKGAVYTGSFLIDAMRARGARDLVQDRYWPSLMAYARASYPKPMATIITSASRWYVRFDVNIHVTCAPEERMRRMEARGARDRIDRSLMRDPAFADRYESELTAIMSRLDNYLRLDTTGRTVDESAAIVLAHIEGCR